MKYDRITDEEQEATLEARLDTLQREHRDNALALAEKKAMKKAGLDSSSPVGDIDEEIGRLEANLAIIDAAHDAVAKELAALPKAKK